MWISRLRRSLTTFLITVIAGGLLSATLVRFGPGFGIQDQELDPRLGAQTVQALRAENKQERNLAIYYASYLGRMLVGDLGASRSLNRPVIQLLAERVPVTLRLLGAGVSGAWVLALSFAAAGALWREPAFHGFSTVFTGLLLCIPAALLALAAFFFGWPVWLVISLVLFPKLFRYVSNVFTRTYEFPYVLAARARGLSAPRILLRHVMAAAAPELLALSAVSIITAFGAAIPVEVICDLPGLGQLAWKATLARDLPLLIDLTILITGVTQLLNSASDSLTAACFNQTV